MNKLSNLFQENKKSVLSLLVLLYVLLTVVFFLFYRPNSVDLKSKKAEQKSLTEEIDLLNAQIEQSKANEEADKEKQLERAKSLPMTPEVNQMILTLEEIEANSESSLQRIGFFYDGALPELPLEEGTTEEASSTEKPVINLEDKPENLQVITMDVLVTSPSYNHFHTLVKEIEAQERMMIVSTMNFDQTTDDESGQSVSAVITLSTFYYE